MTNRLTLKASIIISLVFAREVWSDCGRTGVVLFKRNLRVVFVGGHLYPELTYLRRLREVVVVWSGSPQRGFAISALVWSS